MAIFKCKMCGGALEINNNETVATCEYCGTQQTLPKLDDDRKANLYDRANHFRRNNEFDKAMGIYEQILNEDNSDAESYWSLVLCRYGIEYVEDPSSHKRVPTVNRAQFTSVFDDEDYKSALKYADDFQKEVYEAEAKVINEIQKGILAISQQEEPFDVFICYKETDSNGRRTQDSVIATELYHELTREGYKVFFSRITLEDKLGTAYEPYIFAALNSSKVMVVLGTKPEYFNAVWVKNEWSRYLSLIKNGEKKILIPAYRDMDPYDLPEEFSHLQAQDMTKLGFMQDLIRGINKLVRTEAPQPTVVKETVVKESANGNVTSLLKRGFMALEDGEWNKADDFFEQSLNFDAELAEAYLGKLMSELKVCKKENLKDCAEPFDTLNNYQKAVRFGDDSLKKELSGYIEYIITRNENARLEALYNEALTAESRAKSSDDYLRVASFFEKIIPFKDSQKHKEDNLKKANEQKTIEEQNAEQKKQERAVQQLKKAKQKKIAEIAGLCIFGVVAVFVIVFCLIIPNTNYNNAVELMEAGKYEEAISVFENIKNFKDSAEQIEICKNESEYGKAISFLDEQNYIDAIRIFDKLDNFKDSKSKKIIALKECRKGNNILSAGDGHTVGLKSDGTVIATGNNAHGQCDISNWTDIIAVEAGYYHTVGLKSDGTVVAIGNNKDGQCDVSNWTDIVAVSAGGSYTVGLKKDGTAVVAGDSFYRNDVTEKIPEWTDIIKISVGDRHIVGLKSDGTVVACGNYKSGQCKVSGWTDIVAISAGDTYTVGLKSDGTAVAVGEHNHGEGNVSEWRNTISISACSDHTVGLLYDGTVDAVGTREDMRCFVSDWGDVVAISAGFSHTVGLKSDGTVVATGSNKVGQCDVSDWDLF